MDIIDWQQNFLCRIWGRCHRVTEGVVLDFFFQRRTIILQITISIAVFRSATPIPYRKEVRTVEMKPDMVMMKGGKMMVMRHGEMKPMDMVMTMPNGSKVMMDGTIMMADGTTRMMMDGEAMTMDGEMTTMEDMKEMEGNVEDKPDEM
jgi:hypothetical protein